MRIVEAVLAGETFRSAGAIVGLSGARTAQNFYKACEELGISKNVEVLRADPEPARKAVRERMCKPSISLPEPVLRKLLGRSGYSTRQLTPENISQESAGKVLARFGPTVLMEVEKWLAMHGLSMRASEAETPDEIGDIERALAVLRAYGIHVEVTRSQMPLWQT